MEVPTKTQEAPNSPKGEAVDYFCKDIATHGLIEPIWLYEGKIIDGRNRYRACVKVGIPPAFRTWNGYGSLVEFIVSLNLHRRHLTPSQKAVIALDLLPMLEAEAKERQRAAGETHGRGMGKVDQKTAQPISPPIYIRANQQAAQILGANHDYIAEIKRMARVAPERVDESLFLATFP